MDKMPKLDVDMLIKFRGTELGRITEVRDDYVFVHSILNEPNLMSYTVEVHEPSPHKIKLVKMTEIDAIYECECLECSNTSASDLTEFIFTELDIHYVLSWKRQEPRQKSKQMTVDEISEALGYDVTIID